MPCAVGETSARDMLVMDAYSTVSQEELGRVWCG